MTYDLALYPASGPGLGHLMRCMALAEWAVERKLKTVVVLKEPLLRWPCPVLYRDRGKPERAAARVAIGDAVTLDPLDHHTKVADQYWQIVDAPVLNPLADGYIYPHFGARPVRGVPTLYGEQWMPLRREFRVPPRTVVERGRRVAYRAPKELRGYEALHGSAAQVRALLVQARVAWVPASTVAYEALACGCPVVLHEAGSVPAVADAMVDAGIAALWDGEGQPQLLTFEQPVIDGMGARRLLEALL